MTTPEAVSALRHYAESQVGSFVRKRMSSDSHPIGEWVQVLMVVPSRNRLCWLVRLFDGNVDVWPVPEPGAGQYEFGAHEREDQQPPWADAQTRGGACIVLDAHRNHRKREI